MMRISHTTFALSVAVAATMAFTGCKNNTQEKLPQDSTTTTTTTPAPATATPDTGKSGMAMNAPATGPLSDANIFAKLDAANSEEINEGKVGSEKAKDAEVKKFAQMMVTDHSKMKQEGADLASRLKIAPQVPAGDSSAMMAKEMMDMLNMATPAQFDSEFVAMQVMCHERTLNDLTRMQGMATNDSLKALIGSAIPVVQSHLDKAHALQAKTGGAGTKMGKM